MKHKISIANEPKRIGLTTADLKMGEIGIRTDDDALVIRPYQSSFSPEMKMKGLILGSGDWFTNELSLKAILPAGTKITIEVGE